MLEHQLHGRAPLLDRLPEIAAQHGEEEVDVLNVPRAVEPEKVTRVSDLRLGGRRVDEERGGIAGEADEKEHRGHHTPDDEEGVQQPSQEKARHPGAGYFVSATPRKSMLSSVRG